MFEMTNTRREMDRKFRENNPRLCNVKPPSNHDIQMCELAVERWKALPSVSKLTEMEKWRWQ